MKLLEVENLSLELKQDDHWNSVLSSITFSLNRGETIGIVGESGSGKSVTALSIMQLLSGKMAKITEGSIFFDATSGVKSRKHINLSAAPEKELRMLRGNRMAMIFQEPMTSLNPVLKCGKQVSEALLLHTHLSKKEVKQKTLELFADVQLPEPEKVYLKYPHELSGGQKQRVMIAMAMSCHPDILIADEPTTALDVTVQKNILELLKQLQAKYGMAILFISHDLGVVAQIAHRVVVMYKGKIVEQGEAQSVLKSPKHEYTQSLLACRITAESAVPPRSMSGKQKVETGKQKALFAIENLSKSYPIRKKNLFEMQTYFQALENINLTIYEGETLGLVGESGCGKTTLGRTLLRLVAPDSGKIFYNGIDLTTISDKKLCRLRKEVQIILQDPYASLNQRLTVGQMLIEPMKVHRILNNDRERRKKAITLLERVGLQESHLHRYPHEFSGGQRQRIVIARALTVEPKFIVCDESVSALDVSVQAQVIHLLNDLKKEFQLTYLFISHDLAVVKYLSDRVAVMQQGRIVELNDAEELYRNPQTEYAKRLIEAIPRI